VLVNLPQQLRDQLMFPDGGTQRHRLASRMPLSMAWVQLLCQNEPLPLPSIEQLMEVDPGTRPLPKVLTNPYRPTEEA